MDNEDYASMPIFHVKCLSNGPDKGLVKHINKLKRRADGKQLNHQQNDNQ